MLRRPLSFFFFFQAEDGIRDYKVTGVQTCALPIFLALVPRGRGANGAAQLRALRGDHPGGTSREGARRGLARAIHGRSEERRVGKGGGRRWGAGEGRSREGSEDGEERSHEGSGECV